jgi:hypothetical protein
VVESNLPDYSGVKYLGGEFSAQSSSGPFGLAVRSIEQTDQGVLVTLEVNAFNLPNLGKETDSVTLRITDIVDHQDKSLLADLGCTGALTQAVPVNAIYDGTIIDNGSPINFTGIQGAKQILLPASINAASIGAIKGVIEHQLATSVEHIKLQGPLSGKVINVHDLQLRFLTAGPSRLQFQVTGNTDALLQVNALNSNEQALASTNAMRGPNFFDAGKLVTLDFLGRVAGAEAIVASELQKTVYEFSIARLYPAAKEFAIEKTAPELLTEDKLNALKKDTPPNDVRYPNQIPQQTVAAGPALIAVNELSVNPQGVLTLVADVYTRNLHPLSRQLGAVQLMITEVEDAEGNLHSVNQLVPVAMEPMGGYWANGVFQADSNQPWLRGQVELRERALEVNNAVALWGKLVFVAAEEPIQIKVPFQFALQWSSSAATVKLRRIEAGKMLFDIYGSFPELVAIKALDENDAVVSQSAELRSSMGRHVIELDVEKIPDSIEFNIARTQHSAEFPLEIRVVR